MLLCYAADQYALIIIRIIKLILSLRLSCVYGQNQWGTEDQGWISVYKQNNS